MDQNRDFKKEKQILLFEVSKTFIPEGKYEAQVIGSNVFQTWLLLGLPKF